MQGHDKMILFALTNKHYIQLLAVSAKLALFSPSESGLVFLNHSSTKQISLTNTLLNSNSHSLTLPSALMLVYAFLGRIRSKTRLSIGKGQSQSTH